MIVGVEAIPEVLAVTRRQAAGLGFRCEEPVQEPENVLDGAYGPVHSAPLSTGVDHRSEDGKRTGQAAYGDDWNGLLRAPEGVGKQPTPDPHPASAQPSTTSQDETFQGSGEDTILTRSPAVLQGERCLMRH